MEMLRVALVQMRCEKGAIAANLEAMAAYLREGAAQGAQIVCFPEGSLTGYVDPGRYPEAVVWLDGPEVARFVALTRGSGATALAGVIEANQDGPPFITQVAARDGSVVGVYRKRTIPDDERALFAPGAQTAAVFTHAGVTCGMAICADIERAEVFADCAHQGARVIFEAAAPGLYGEQATRDWRAGYEWWRGECATKLATYARENGVYVAVATQAGRTRDEDFPGGGYLFGPDGTCLASSLGWSEGMLCATVALA
jgi:predicted amidohydrolase